MTLSLTRRPGATLAPLPTGARARGRRSLDSPVRRLLESDARALTTRELVAMILDPRRGEEWAMLSAGHLRDRFHEPGAEGYLRRLASAAPGEIAGVPGVGRASAARLLAALELGRRAQEEAAPARDCARYPRTVYERMRIRMRDLRREEVVVLLLNVHREVLREEVVSRGGLVSALVHPREVLRSAIVHSAHSILLVHNHPSGDPTPSAGDRTVTEQLARAARTVSIPLVDHIIIGEGRYFSFAEDGLLWISTARGDEHELVCG